MNTRQRRNIKKSHQLYEEEAKELLETALKVAQANTDTGAVTKNYVSKSFYNSSEDEDEESDDSSSSDEENEAGEEEPTIDLDSKIAQVDAVAQRKEVKPKHQGAATNSAGNNQRNKRQTQTIMKQMGDPPLINCPLEHDKSPSSSEKLFLGVPSALLSKENKSDSITIVQSMLHLAHGIGSQNSKNVVVLLLRSGRFAGGVFQGGKCLQHRACQRYTVRRGQGKAQSSRDGQKGKAKSMGAQLRRQGEENLREDVTRTLAEWRPLIENSAIIFISCLQTMKKGLFEDGDTDEFLSRNDSRIRKVPLDFGRPTFEAVCAVHESLMRLLAWQGSIEETAEETNPESPAIDVTGADDTKKVQPRKEKEEVQIEPMTPLHIAAAEGDLSSISEILEIDAVAESQIDLQAGEDLMTPLHYAALSKNGVDPSVAALCVYTLLVEGKANPCIVDKRNRPAYFLSSHDKTRESFRLARAKLGEDFCLWDDKAKVPPSLTEDDVQQRKEKAAEKKRRQRVRQKEKKAKEKAQAAEMERLQKEQEEQRKREEDAKRARDGLKPKTSTATNVCDFCQKVCKGKRRSQMFQRLDYAYCSSECVQKHKRELMASAALSRFGG